MGFISDIGNKIGDIFDDGVDWVEDTVSDFIHDPLDALGGLAEDIGKGFLGIATLGYSNKYDKGFFTDLMNPDSPVAEARDRKITSRGTIAHREIVYGRVKKGGTVVYIESSGEDAEFLHLIIVLASHSCKSINTVYFNEAAAATGGAMSTENTQLFTVPTEFVGKYEMWAQLGEHTEVHPDILSNTPAGWTAAHKLLGQTYLYVKLKYDTGLFKSGIPNINVIMDGKNDIYDPRDLSTGFSRNHSLCCLDYIRSQHGMNIPDSEILTESFETAADIADEVVATGPQHWDLGVLTEPRYVVDGVVSINKPPIKNLQELFSSGGAWISRPQGRWAIVPTGYDAPTISFNETDLISGIQFSPSSGKQGRINSVSGSFVNPYDNWELTDYPPMTSSSYIASDLEELTATTNYSLVTSGYQCQRLGKIKIERSRFGLTVSGVFKFKALQLTVGQSIDLSIEDLGWSAKVFKVVDIDLSLIGGIAITLREDSAQIMLGLLAMQPK